MGGYIPGTSQGRSEMCAALGIDSPERLFDSLKGGALLERALNLPSGMSEMRVYEKMSGIAQKNHAYRSIFRGAGAEKHYIPAIVDSVASREEFLTAYTPYQPEMSQGVLQSIFEYQSMLCDLFNMDVSNASVYDAASALGEAAQMCRERARQRVLISGSVNPRYIEAVKTYAAGKPVDVIPVKDGVTDVEALKQALSADVACVIVQQPNFFGLVENLDVVSEAAHSAGAKAVACFHPLAAAIYKTAGECGFDVCVGEGQPLGLPLSYGGPYLGLMTCTKAMMRRMPGRIVGETVDAEGERAFVLTLQAREQHIRREKASSSVCSNQALCALRAGVYMAAMGADGMQNVASVCHDNAVYMEQALKNAGLTRIHTGEYFCEFVTDCPADKEALLEKLSQRGILGGLPVDGGILWCATECTGKDSIDELAEAVREVLK